MRDAVLDDAAQQVVVVPDAQLDLHGGDVGDAARLFDLPDGHVAESDVRDQALILQRGERADARGERRSRIGRVKLIEIDPLDLERAKAGFAGGAKVACAPVGDPFAIGPGQPALRGDADARPIASSRQPGGQRPARSAVRCDRLRRVPAIRVGRVEEGDAGVERRVQHLRSPRVVAFALGRQAHAAHPD